MSVKIAPIGRIHSLAFIWFRVRSKETFISLANFTPNLIPCVKYAKCHFKSGIFHLFEYHRTGLAKPRLFIWRANRKPSDWSLLLPYTHLSVVVIIDKSPGVATTRYGNCGDKYVITMNCCQILRLYGLLIQIGIFKLCSVVQVLPLNLSVSWLYS
ncbi:hypothetical protein IWW34DRAFT_226385 [Fusarium oxysporum f. sp. albedinis]|nr:hypothetical protein IWW34DRAFT_226385 [Fusarium oxysporum f. sp. albedinis]